MIDRDDEQELGRANDAVHELGRANDAAHELFELAAADGGRSRASTASASPRTGCWR
jgi:hypothetical protein